MPVLNSNGVPTTVFKGDLAVDRQEGNGPESVVTLVGGATGSLSASGRSVVGGVTNTDGLGTATIDPFGLLVAAATGGGGSRMMIFSSTVPFSVVEVGYKHAGGFGAATGIIACVAPTDDPGPLNYALGNVAELKKMVTPKRSGAEYNTISADGWQLATWGGGNTSATAADAGTGKISVAWSDLIPCQGILASDGLYYGIVRWFEAVGPYTYGTYPGMTTGTQYQDAAGFAKIAYSLKSGDAVTTPSNWSTANTLTITDSPGPNIVVRIHSILEERPLTVMAIGDSRFDAVTEAPYNSTQGYESFSFKLAKYLNSLNKKTHLIRCAQGGLASQYYFQRAMLLLDNCSPDIALYVGYSINDGSPTRALVDAAKARIVQFVRKCLLKGVKPYIVSSYPRGGMTAAENTLLVELDSWLEASGLLWFSPLSVYGNGSGDWAAGVSADGGNHMKQAYYQDMAQKVGDDLVAKVAI